MTRARPAMSRSTLKLAMPLDIMLSSSGPSTPAPYDLSRPRTLPVHVSPSGSTGSSMSSGSGTTVSDEEPRTPHSALAGLVLESPDEFASHVTKKSRDTWGREEVLALERILARPPPHMAFPPGSLPPPHLLDELASAVICSYTDEGGSAGDDEWSANSRESSPASGAWPHTFAETRSKLVSLALAETRLGAELAERKMTRQQRLARPGIKRVGSMDYLDDDGATESMPSESIGRVLRLSTTLQNSAKDAAKTIRDRSASLSVPGAMAPGAMKRMGSLPTEKHLPYRAPPPMRRCSSGRVEHSTSRRPSLLARGRSFTASDLEAEADAAAAAEAAQSVIDEDRAASDTDTEDAPSPSYFNFKETASPRAPKSLLLPEISPKTSMSGFADSLPVPEPEAGETALAVPGAPLSPAVTVSAPTLSPPSKRRAPAPERLGLGRSKSYTPSTRPHAQRDSFLDGQNFTSQGLTMSPPTHPDGLGPALDSAFEPSGRSDTPVGWESDSDHEPIIQPRKKRIGTLAMTAMKSAARSGSSGSSSGSATPPLIISTMVDEEALRDGSLRSPFEERQVELS